MIRPAKPVASDTFTKISFDSKRYWGYPEKHFAIWNDELIILNRTTPLLILTF
jgi:hypothetical protein